MVPWIRVIGVSQDNLWIPPIQCSYVLNFCCFGVPVPMHGFWKNGVGKIRSRSTNWDFSPLTFISILKYGRGFG